MRRRQIDARVVFVVRGGPLEGRLESAGVPYVTLGASRGRDVCLRPRAFGHLLAAHGRDGAVLIEANYLAAALRLGGYRGRLVATEHGAIFLHEHDSRKKKATYRLGRLLGAKALDVEVAVSDAALVAAERHSHTREMIKISSGVDVRSLQPTPPRRGPPFVLGYVGRLDRGKGVDVLLDAVASVPPEHGVELRIAGEGPVREALEDQVRGRSAADRIVFVGVVDDISRFWATCSLAVVPSDVSENVPLAALEAMACARPVVASRIGGIPEVVIEDETGILVRPGDRDALAAAILHYVRHPELVERHGAAGRKRCELLFDIEHTVESYVALFDRAS